MEEKKTKKKKVVKRIILLIVLLFALFAFWTFWEAHFRINYSENLYLLNELDKAFEETVSQMESDRLWDEASIEEYNKLFDGEEHHLQDIDLHTNFGKTLASKLYHLGVGSFGEYVSLLRVENNYYGDLVIKYIDDRTLVFTIPHSNKEYRFWKVKKDAMLITDITYVEPHNKE